MSTQNLRIKLSVLMSAMLFFTGCEAIELLNTVNQVLKPADQATEGSANPNASGQPSASGAPLVEVVAPVDVVTPKDVNPVSTDWNMLRQPGVQLQVSSVLNPTFDKERLFDGKLTTSWFSSTGDSPSRGKLPTIEMSFPKPVGVIGINLRGDRERQAGIPVKELSLLITSPQGILMNENILLPDEGTDFNLVLKKPVDNASSIRLTFTKDNGHHPAFSEIEVIGRQ